MTGAVVPPGELASRRLARFVRKPQIVAIADKYKDFVQSNDGITMNLLLAGLALQRINKLISQRGYQREIKKLALKFGIPLSDAFLMADCAFETIRCGLLGTGQHPQFTLAGGQP